jgi:hypothetical protein
MATQPSANPKICSHSFSECSLNPVYLNCTVYDMRKGSFVSRVWVLRRKAGSSDCGP